MTRGGQALWGIFMLVTRVQLLDASGTFLLAFGSAGAGNGQFSRPSGVAVSPEGTILVADTGNDRVQAFDAAGKFLFTFGSPTSGASRSDSGVLSAPTGVAVGPNGRIGVA